MSPQDLTNLVMQLSKTSLPYERLFYQLMENSPAAIALLDQEMRYVQVSQRWLSDHGLSHQNIIGKFHYEVFGELPARWQEIYKRCQVGIVERWEQESLQPESGKTRLIKWEAQLWSVGLPPQSAEQEIAGLLLFAEIVSCASTAAKREVIPAALSLSAAELDATDRQLAQAPARLTAILEATTDFVGITDAQGHLIYINSAGRQMLGLGEDFDITATYLEDYYPWSANRLIQQVALPTAIREGVWNGETAFQFGDGPIVPVSQVLIAHKSAGGKVEFFSTIARDITERKQAQEEQQKLIALIEGSSEFIGLATLAGQAIYLNEAGQRLVGLEGMSAVKQTSIPEYFTPEDLDYFLKHIFPIVLQKGRWEGEFRFRHFQTGRVIPIYYNFFTIKDRQTGQPMAVATVTRNITEQKRFIEALRQSEALLRQQVQREQLRGSLTSQIRNSLDLDTVLETAIREIRSLLQIDRCQFAWYFPNGDPPYWSVVKEAHKDGLRDFTGRYEASALEPLAHQLLQLEILRVDDMETAENSVWRQFLQSRGVASLLVLPIQIHSGAISLISCIHSSGTRHWSDSEVELLSAVTDQLAIAINQAKLYAQTHEAAVRAQQQATQIAGTLHKLQRTQAQLIQSEKMSSLGQLVAGVAHEINNPVNFIYGNLIHASEYVQGILGLLNLYQQEYPNPKPEILSEIEAIDLAFLRQDLPKLLSSMKVGAERIREIVHSLRTFSRTDEAERKAVNIHEGIESTLMILQNRLKARSDRLAIQLVKVYGNLPLVECYPGQLNQVFMNLLSNAIDALEGEESKEDLHIQNPQIWIRTSVIDNSRVAIAIADNGPGMTEEVRKHLFDPFFTTKPVGKGTGLGLSISYQIVQEKHGGRLKCVSAPGQGAEFLIEIPIRQ